MRSVQVVPVDPFDLPDWLGTSEVTWRSLGGIHDGHHLAGELSAGDHRLPCDLLGADQAYPQPVLAEGWRHDSHQAWTYGQVLLVEYDGRLTLAVPGTGFTADLVLEGLARFAKAIGVEPSRFVAALRL